MVIELSADPRWKYLEAIWTRRLEQANRNLADLRDIHEIARNQGRVMELREALDLRSRSLKVLLNAEAQSGTARS